jgi:hypothetical protein
MAEHRARAQINAIISDNYFREGRAHLNAEFRAELHGVEVIWPDKTAVLKVLLLTKGFSSARNIAPRIFQLFKQSFDKLSQAESYNWGLRSAKKLLDTVEYGANEVQAVEAATRKYFEGKIEANDQAQFNAIFDKVFAN